MLLINLPNDVERQLDALAAARGRTTASYAEAALIEYLADLADVAEAEERLKALREGRSTTISLEDFVENHGLED